MQTVDASLDQLGQIDRGEVEIELAGIDLGNVEQIVEQAERVEPALMDVLDISLVARIADGAEALLEHELGEAENRIERRAHFVADLGKKIEAPRDRGRIGLLLVLLGLGDGLRLRIGGLRLGVEHRAIDEAKKLKLAGERFHVEADLEAPAAAGQRLDGDRPLPSVLRARVEQGHAAGDDGLEASRGGELVKGTVAEGIGEGGIGMNEVAMGENADRRRHRFEQRLDAGAAQGERLEPERAGRRQ